MHPHAYNADTCAVLGTKEPLPHDDSVNDRAKGSRLCEGEQLTRQLWRRYYGVDYWRRGAMYRGHLSPAQELFATGEQRETDSTATVRTVDAPLELRVTVADRMFAPHVRARALRSLQRTARHDGTGRCSR